MTINEATDLTGVGKIVDSELVKDVYQDALSPAVKEVGYLSRDLAKSFRLCTAPFQLMAAYQNRLEAFCERVAAKVPEEFQQEAAANIARPVIEEITFTEDDSPLMSMFEELMSKAIDSRVASKINPTFPGLIKNLSPLEAKLIKALNESDQITDDEIKFDENLIVKRLYSNFSFDDFGGQVHHLTLIQNLKIKNIVNITNPKVEPDDKYSSLILESGHEISRSRIYLTMNGRWFADICVRNK